MKMRKTWLLAGAVAVALALGMVPAVGRAALESRGEVLPEPDGYPLSYTDFTGLTLGMCTDVTNCLAGTGLNGNQNGFEGFYWVLDGGVALPNGGLYLMALEAATFANPAAPGGVDRTLFYRYRFRMDVTVAGDYTIRHPFGTQTYTNVQPGTRAINDTIDLGLVPGNFDTVLPVFGALLGGTPAPGFPNGGQFITWDETLPAPPPGFAGNFNVPHTIVPGPSGLATLTIEGPPNSLSTGGSTFTTANFQVAAQIQGNVPPRIVTANKAAPLTASRISGPVTKVLDWMDPNGPNTITAALTPDPLPPYCTHDLPLTPPFPNKVTITCTPDAATPQETTPAKLTIADALDPTQVDSVAFSVVVDNLAPVVSQPPPTSVANDSTARVVIPVTASDPDGNGIANITATLTPAASTGSTWFSFTKTGQNTGEIVIQGPIPVADGNRVYAIDIHVTDAGTPTRLTEISASLQVNNAPTVIVQGGGGGGGCSSGGGAGLFGLALVPLLLRRRRTP